MPDASAPRGLADADAERVRRALSCSLAENTRRACLGHWAAFGSWCAEHDYTPAPAAAETVAAHLAAIAETGVSASTLKVRRSAIGTVHRASGMDDPMGSTRSPRPAGWKSAGMVIRYTRRETAKRGAVARHLEDRQEPSG